MELISREKLKEVIEPMVGTFDDDGEFWWTRESILSAIDNAPIIEERKEGRWIRTEGELICSLCEYPAEFNPLSNDFIETNYCPNCGSYNATKMIGE